MAPKPRFTVLMPKRASEVEFVEFWASLYSAPNEQLYDLNIGKRLTDRRLSELFEWKNGGPLSVLKAASVRRHYLGQKPTVTLQSSRSDLVDFISRSGGAIWRIFWLHCHDHDTYPIFDQHVYRAMRFLQTGNVMEVPVSNKKKATCYVDEYVPFYESFAYPNPRIVDKALWSFGKLLVTYPQLALPLNLRTHSRRAA